MRVQLDNGRNSVDLDVSDTYGQSFLALVVKALKALDYTEKEIKEFLEDDRT